MHDPVNTMGGRFAFRVEFLEGGIYSELHSLWDEVPKDGRVKRLSLFEHTELGDVEHLVLEGYARYGFGNEAVSVVPFGGSVSEPVNQLTAKIFVVVNGDGTAEIFRVNLTGPEPTLQRASGPAADLPFNAATYRPGVA